VAKVAQRNIGKRQLSAQVEVSNEIIAQFLCTEQRMMMMMMMMMMCNDLMCT